MGAIVPVTTEEGEGMLRMAREGASVQKIAVAFNRSEETVRSRLKGLGFTMPKWARCPACFGVVARLARHGATSPQCVLTAMNAGILRIGDDGRWVAVYRKAQ